jgi:prepilin-type N-terminal cleavage/methylation domain-containing protein
MRVFTSQTNQTRKGAFTLPEVLVSMAVVGLLVLSLFGGLSSGMGAIRAARENLRATQILEEKMEVFRAYSWDQITTNAASIPTNFVAYFYPTNISGSTSVDLSKSGTVYTGVLTIAESLLGESYSNDLKKVTATVTWQSGAVLRQRSMDTMVSRYGMRNYLY